MKKISVVILGLLLVLFSIPVKATPISESTVGLSCPQATITFSEVVLLEYAPIGQAYAGYGVVFSDNIRYGTENTHMPAGPNFNPPDVLNLPYDGETWTNSPIADWVITFDKVQKEVAFAYASDPTVTTFTAKRHGVVVEQFSVYTTFGPDVVNNIFGFKDIRFDQVEISVDFSYDLVVGSGIDNLQFSAKSCGEEEGDHFILRHRNKRGK